MQIWQWTISKVEETSNNFLFIAEVSKSSENKRFLVTGTDFEAVIDLGKEKPIKYVAARFVQDIRSWIWIPKDVTFLVSTDGELFTELAVVKNTIPYDDYEIVQKDLGVKVITNARFVKVKATNYGKIPQWHLGEGGSAFIFIDEIIVE